MGKRGREAEAEHQWRHEHGKQLGEQLQLELGPLNHAELIYLWEGIAQSIAIDNGLDRDRLGLLVVAARLKAKRDLT